MESSDWESRFDPFRRGLSLLMAWRLSPPFQASVRYRIGSDPIQTVLLDASPTTLEYTLTAPDGRILESYDGYAHTSEQGGRVEMLSPYSVVNEAIAARLAFPLSLPIWGRTTEEYRFTGHCNEAGDKVRMALVHTRNNQLRGTLVLSVPRRMAVEIDTPNLFIAYEEIRRTDSSQRPAS